MCTRRLQSSPSRIPQGKPVKSTDKCRNTTGVVDRDGVPLAIQQSNRQTCIQDVEIDREWSGGKSKASRRLSLALSAFLPACVSANKELLMYVVLPNEIIPKQHQWLPLAPSLLDSCLVQP